MDKCEVHMTELVEGPIPVRYGLIRWSEAFQRASRALFPNANSTVPGGCIMGPSSPKEARGTFCTRCREAEREWIRRPSPLAGLDVPGKEKLVATLNSAREQLALQIGRAAEALFPMALEMAWIQLKLNLLAREHGVVDEDFSCTRVDLLLDDAFADCVRGMQETLPALKRKHYDAIHRPGWAR